MALKLEFKSGEKMIINGAVLENAGPHARLLVHNHANIMRGREVLSLEDSKTPASRTYFALQCAYLFPENRAQHLQQFDDLLSSYASASPSAAPIIQDIRAAVTDGDLYKGLRETRRLVEHELHVLTSFYDHIGSLFDAEDGEGSDKPGTDRQEDGVDDDTSPDRDEKEPDQ